MTTREQSLDRLREVLDRYRGSYKQLNGGRDLGDYLGRARPREDEELLTEPVLADLLERLLGFPRDAYFPQLGRSGLKPDFTPHDLVAHRFVLDAKSSTQELDRHEPQIRAYIDQRELDYGVLFNLREVRAFRRGERGHAPELSFPVLALWRLARGEALPDQTALDAFAAFAERFTFREMGLEEKVGLIRSARPWLDRRARGEQVDIDLDFLVERLRDLSRLLQADAAERVDVLESHLAMSPAKERALRGELELLALDLEPRAELSELPSTVRGWRDDDGLAGRAWRQYLLLRVVALEDEAAAAAALGSPSDRGPDRDALLAEMADRAGGRAGRRRGLHVHRIRQRDLDPAVPWPIKHGARDVAAKVVAALDRALADETTAVGPLECRWHIFQGIQTGADAYSARIQRRLTDAAKRRLEAEGARTGDPILELPPGREDEPPWRDHPELLARSPESRAVLYAAIDDADYASLVWIAREDPVPETVRAALEPWRAVLSTRADFVANPDRRWFESHRARDKEKLCAPKVIALYRTDRGRFALDEAGDWQPSIKATLCTAREEGMSVAYLCGLLNSELLDVWYAVRGKTPRDVWRNYEPKPMARMPYRHVEAVTERVSTPQLASLDEALAARDPARAAAVAGAIAAAGHALASAAAVEALVRAIAANRRELLPLRALFSGLGRTVKDPWRARVPELSERAVIERAPAERSASVRVDPELDAVVETDGPLGRPVEEGPRLVFARGRQTTATVSGPRGRLALLRRLVEDRPRLMPADLLATLVPRDLGWFEARCDEHRAEVGELLDEGRALVEAVERLVCRLYGLPPELEDAVVSHAVERAARGLPADKA